MTTFTLAVNQTVISILVAVHLRANARSNYMVRAPVVGQEVVGSIPTAAKADVAQQQCRFSQLSPAVREDADRSFYLEKVYVVRSSTGRAPHCE